MIRPGTVVYLDDFFSTFKAKVNAWGMVMDLKKNIGVGGISDNIRSTSWHCVHFNLW